MFFRTLAIFSLLLSTTSAQDRYIGYIEPGDDLKSKIEQLVADGCKTIHILGASYRLKVPLILETDELEIYGHGALIARDFWGRSNGPIILNVCRKLRVTGLVFDIKRPDQWKSYVPMIRFHVDDGVAKRQKYDGPRYKYVEEFIFDNNKIIDSSGKSKNNSEPDQYGKRDQWVIVSNLRLGGNSIVVKNNRLAVPDMELMGGTWGWDNVLIDGNHIWGGQTSGGYIGVLSRYFGESSRVFRSVTITNNVVYHLTNNFISMGYDAKTLANTRFDMIRIEGNIAFLSPDCREVAKLVLFKTREFEGSMIIRGNTIDGSKVSIDRDISPCDVWATNFKWGEKGSHSTVPAASGSIYYEPSYVVVPDGSQWSFTNKIVTSNFETVIERDR